MTEIDWYEIARDAIGTADSPGTIIERLGLDFTDEELEEQFSGEGVETCAGCGWWFADDGTNEAEPLCDDCEQDDE